jgi:hypothetical protein
MSIRIVVFPRKVGPEKQVYYARYIERITGKVLKTKSLGIEVTGKKISRTAADKEAQRLLSEDEITLGDNPLVNKYVLWLWSPESDYCRAREDDTTGLGLSKGYTQRMRDVYDTHFKTYFEKYRMDQLTPRLLESAVETLRKAKVGPRSLQLGVQSIRTASREWARLNRMDDPLRDVRPPRYTAKRKGILTMDELRAVLEVDAMPRIRCAIALAGLAGLRCGEVRGLRWSDIDEVNEWLDVRNNFTQLNEEKGPKANSMRRIPIPGPLMEAIKLCRVDWERIGQGSPYVIWGNLGPTKPLSYSKITQSFWQALRDIGIPNEERERRAISLTSTVNGGQCRLMPISPLRSDFQPNGPVPILRGWYAFGFGCKRFQSILGSLLGPPAECETGDDRPFPVSGIPRSFQSGHCRSSCLCVT